MINYQAPADLLKERVILVTGAGQGLGRIAALEFAKHGATVILLGRKVEKLEQVYDEMLAAGYPEAVIFPMDLEQASDEDFKNMALGIKQQLKRLDGILHNAARYFTPSLLESQPLDQWMTLLRVNLAAPFALTRACLPLLRQAPDASVIMTGETHGHTPKAYWGGFAVSKAGLETLTKIWADEMESQSPQIRINAVIPGPINTPMRTRSHPGELPESRIQPETLMPSYLYLMGPDSKDKNGLIYDLANSEC